MTAAPAVDPDPPEEALQQLHALTPLLQSWRYVAAVLGALFVFFRDNVDDAWRVVDFFEDGPAWTLLLEVLLGLLVVLLAAIAWSFLVWRMTRYALLGRTLFVRRGVVMRQRRQLRLDRIQGVDVSEPLLARLAGLAQLRIEMAAGAGATTTLGYLTMADAQALRADLLSRSGRRDVVEAPERVILRVPTVRVVQARLLELAPGIGGLVAYVLLVTVAVAALGAGFGVLFGAVLPVVPAVIGLAITAVQRIVRDSNFVLADTDDGLRIHSGLLTLSHRTVPVRRVQAVQMVEPLLWRPFGWAASTVDVAGTVAGSSGGGDAKPAANTLVPVASRPESAGILRGLLGVDLAALGWVPVPARARRLDPFAWSWLGVALTDSAAVSRTGWLRRQVAAVPFARIQSVRIRQGWLQRRLGLASVYIDGAQGAQGWVAPHRSLDDAHQLVQILAARARNLRRTEDHWTRSG